MTSDNSVFERLQSAGVIAGEQFSESDKKELDQITDEEANVLIKLHKKMGKAPAGKDHMRPNFGV